MRKSAPHVVYPRLREGVENSELPRSACGPTRHLLLGVWNHSFANSVVNPKSHPNQIGRKTWPCF
jgi:hypothetical protein